MLEPNAETFTRINQFQERLEMQGFRMKIWKTPTHTARELRRWDVVIEHADISDHFGIGASDDLPDAILLACKVLDKLTKQQFSGKSAEKLRPQTQCVLKEARRLLVKETFL